MIKLLCTSALLLLSVPTSHALQQDARQRDSDSASLINIRVSRTTETVNYRDNSSTKIDFQGTALMARAEGKAQIEAKHGRVAIKGEFEHLEPATTFGSAYLTYVLWAISPEGSPNNLGEIILDGSKSKLEVTTNLQNFAMIVTAEPYFGVSFPSEVVVLENIVRGDTKGSVSTVNARFDLLQRGVYDDMHLDRYLSDSKVPLSLYEARNAVRIAKAQGAARYARESWTKAEAALQRAEDYQLRKQHKAVVTAARDAVQAAEDARNIAVKRQDEESIALRQRAADAETARARAAQADEAQARADADPDRGALVRLVVGEALQDADELEGHRRVPLRRLLAFGHHRLVEQQHRVGSHEEAGEADGEERAEERAAIDDDDFFFQRIASGGNFRFHAVS